MKLGKPLDDTSGGVRAAVIDDEQFVRATLPLAVLHDVLEVGKNAGGLVMSRNDDRQVGGMGMMRTEHGTPASPKRGALSGRLSVRTVTEREGKIQEETWT